MDTNHKMALTRLQKLAIGTGTVALVAWLSARGYGAYRSHRAFRSQFVADSLSSITRSLPMRIAQGASSMRGVIKFRCKVGDPGNTFAAKSLEFQFSVAGVDTLTVRKFTAGQSTVLPIATADSGLLANVAQSQAAVARFYEEQRLAALGSMQGLRIDFIDRDGFTAYTIPMSVADVVRLTSLNDATLSAQGVLPNCPGPASSTVSANLYWLVPSQ
jgi:hypothetical protein